MTCSLKQCHHQMHISGLDCLHGRCSPWKDTHKVYDAVSQFWKSPHIELWCYMKASKSCVFSGMSLYEAFGLTSSVFFFFLNNKFAAACNGGCTGKLQKWTCCDGTWNSG